MKVLIIEDEALSAHHLKSMLREIDPDIEITAVLDSIEAALRYFASQPELDLIFMDIELGDGQSFEIFSKINVEWPVIFTTAYQEHALKAFKLNSIDYLLKPINKEELLAAMLKFRKWHAHRGTPNAGVTAMLRDMNNETFKSRYLAKAVLVSFRSRYPKSLISIPRISCNSSKPAQTRILSSTADSMKSKAKRTRTYFSA
ncbi:response regulator [Chitinophaga sedimenti]|uniref:LytR/AlgR family response regulator transcription factor n=1 Tax=Chitinophaga sedimenti TaxID=2033606 RepID=UPI0020064EC0|nr:response regulator [Chitinophaga sedimenti]MCK7553567.1 response regulator [Chitinophaga sedimenti]